MTGEPGPVTDSERIAKTLSWWTKDQYSVADLQRAYAEGEAEASRSVLAAVREGVEGRTTHHHHSPDGVYECESGIDPCWPAAERIAVLALIDKHLPGRTVAPAKRDAGQAESKGDTSAALLDTLTETET